MRRVLVSVGVLALATPAWAVPVVFTHQGRLTDASGAPVTGPHDLTVLLYHSSVASSAAAWSETNEVTFENGFYTVVLGTDPQNPITVDDLDSAELWVGVALDAGLPIGARQLVASVPYAVLAHTATNVVGGTVDAESIAIDGAVVIDRDGQIDWSVVEPPDAGALLDALACADGDVLYHDGIDWSCRPLDAHVHDATDVTTGRLAIDRLPVGSGADQVAAGIHTHDATAVVTGKLGFDRIPIGTVAGTVAEGAHTHAANAITSGEIALARLPVGTTPGTVAAGVHTHDGSAITGGQIGIGFLPVGATSSTVARGDHGHDFDEIGGTLDESQLPALADVAFSGRFDDLIDAPDLPVTREVYLRGADLGGQGAVFSGTVVSSGELILAQGGYGAGLTDLVIGPGQTVTLPAGVHEFKDVTLTGDAVLTVEAWNGATGGRLEIRARGTVTVGPSARIDLDGKGYRGGRAEYGMTTNQILGMNGQPGESVAGWFRAGAATTGANVGGGGAGGLNDSGNYGCAGAGAGYGTAASNRACPSSTSFVAAGGQTYGDVDLTVLHLGSGGGASGSDEDHLGRGGHGGNGGGALRISADTLVVQGIVRANGAAGTDGVGPGNQGGGGGGSGGSIHLAARTVTLASGSTVSATGGAAGLGPGSTAGTAGGVGRVRIDGGTVTSSGTVTPAAGRVNTGAAWGLGGGHYGVWESPAVQIASGRFTEVDLFADRAEGVTIHAELCAAATSGGLGSCAWVPVAPSGAVDVADGLTFAKVRVTVWDRSADRAFGLRGVRFGAVD